jgi:hypothetical protein
MDREALRNVFPALGRVRSIRDVQDRIAELARGKAPGEWIVTMPIGDPPYYFDVPDILDEKRWPTRQELDAAAPNNLVFIRSIWGYWRGTFPLVSCANTAALQRTGITRDTVSPVDTLTIAKDANGDPTGVLIEREMAPIAELIWFKQATAFTPAQRLAALPQSARAYHGFGTTSVFEARRRDRGCASTSRRSRRRADHARTLAFSPNWTAAGAPLGLRRGLGRLAGRARLRQRLAQDERALRPCRARARGRRARERGPYTGWAGFNSNHGPARKPRAAIHCAKNDIRAVMIGSATSISTTRSIARSRSMGGAG